MAFGIATGVSTPPLYPVGGTANTLAATGFIPQIWSGKLVEKFYASTVLAAISNTDYEGEIKNQGDSVKIRTKPTITINDYLADGTLALQRPSGNNLDLLIDKGKYFNTILDDVMDVQSDLNNLSIWSDNTNARSSYQRSVRLQKSENILKISCQMAPSNAPASCTRALFIRRVASVRSTLMLSPLCYWSACSEI